MRIESGLVIGLLVIGTLYVSGRIYHDTQMVTVTTRDLVIEDLPDDFDGFKIVHISDFQADQLTDQDLMQQYVDTVNSTHPDHGGNAISGRPLYHKQHAYVRKQRPRSYHGPYTLPGAG